MKLAKRMSLAIVTLIIALAALYDLQAYQTNIEIWGQLTHPLPITGSLFITEEGHKLRHAIETASFLATEDSKRSGIDKQTDYYSWSNYHAERMDFHLERLLSPRKPAEE